MSAPNKSPNTDGQKRRFALLLPAGQLKRSRRAARNANGELRGAPLARLVRCALIRAPRTNRSIGRLGYRREPARAATRSAAQLAVMPLEVSTY